MTTEKSKILMIEGDGFLRKIYKNKLIKEISRDSKVSVNGKRKVPFQLP